VWHARAECCSVGAAGGAPAAALVRDFSLASFTLIFFFLRQEHAAQFEYRNTGAWLDLLAQDFFAAGLDFGSLRRFCCLDFIARPIRPNPATCGVHHCPARQFSVCVGFWSSRRCRSGFLFRSGKISLLHLCSASVFLSPDLLPAGPWCFPQRTGGVIHSVPVASV
jgi:hypothetical protein